MPFEKGHTLATGRKKGSLNKSTIADRELLATILEELKQIRIILDDAEITVYPEQPKIVEPLKTENPVVKVKAVEAIPTKKREPNRPRFITVTQQIEEARLLRLKNTK
jgi:hypothetical protein